MIAELSLARPVLAVAEPAFRLASPPRTLTAPGSGSALWYLSRGTGIIVLVLLTLVVVLGVITRRGTAPGPGQVVAAGVHRNASLLVLALLGVHVVTAVLDPYAPIRLADTVIPFGSAYRPLWLGLGAMAFDLLIALVVTSLARVRIGLRWWRNVHWLAYAAWPFALLHGLGTGTDTSTRWALLITAACVAAVVVAVVVRVRMLKDRWPGRSAGAAGAAMCAPLAIGAWLLIGPLGPDWAARSGTPSQLLHAGSASSAQSSSGGSPARSSGTGAPHGSAFWSGTLTQRDAGSGKVELLLTGPLSGGPGGRLTIRLVGAPSTGGGIAMSSGTAELAPAAGSVWHGPVTGLDGDRIAAQLAGPGGGSVRMRAVVQAQDGSQALSGRATFG
jgi:sulfoxide reductase heme-binding subunit YedZ